MSCAMRNIHSAYQIFIAILLFNWVLPATASAVTDSCQVVEGAEASLSQFSQSAGPTSIIYDIDLSLRQSHQFRITVNLSGLNRDFIELVMPVWTAQYRIRLFGRNVFEVAAQTRDGLFLEVKQVTLGRWRVNTQGAEEVLVSYMVYANEPSPYAAQLNMDHAFLNPAAVLMYLSDSVGEPVTLRFEMPPSWRVFSSMEPTFDPTVFRAASYLEMIRSPVEISDCQDIFFTARGMNVTVALSGNYSGLDRHIFSERLERLVTKAIDLFGMAPASDYLFLLHFPDASIREVVGHPTSTAVHWGFYSRTEPGDMLLRTTLEGFLHSWLGGMIQPESVSEATDLRGSETRSPDVESFLQPSVIESLWFLDGVSDYYATLLLNRSGMQPAAVFLDRIGAEITMLQNTPARYLQSVTTASQEVWYRDDVWYRSPLRSINHRNKGFLLALLLDLEMRNASSNQRSLDDLIGFMAAWYGREGREYEGSKAILQAVGALTGWDFTQFLSDYVQGTEELPYERILALGGWSIRPETEEIAVTGFEASEEGIGTLLVSTIEQNSTAARAGIRAGDRIVAANGSFMVGNLNEIVRTSRPGDILTLRIQRGMLQEEIAFPLGSGVRQAFIVETIPSPTQNQRAIGAGILSGIP